RIEEMKAGAQSRTKGSVPSFTPVSSGLLQRKCACGGSPSAGGECSECRQKKLQRKAASNDQTPSIPPIVHDVLRSPGQPLDEGTRALLEPRFGHDFSRVRVHTDGRAAESARAVNALAYTVGRDVVFGSGQYSPEARAGRHLLAHELTHVVQQGTAEIGEVSLPIGPTDHPAEREADAAADAVLHNRLASGVGKAETPRLLRVPAPEAPQSPDSGEPADHRRLDEPLPYREATELATCNRIMGPGSEEYCRQQVLGEQPPPSPESPSVEIRSANLATGVGLRFGPAGTTGTLNLDLTGAGPSYRVATGPRNAGTTNENFNVPTLPIREFTGLRATWTVNGSDFVDTRAFHIQVLGIFRHSQYNVPNENSCGGAPVHAYLTDSHCHFAPIMLRSGFIAQANLNGSGVSMTHGNVVRENVCLGNPAAPADA